MSVVDSVRFAQKYNEMHTGEYLSPAGVISSSLSALPANGVWQQGTAPAERWKALADNAAALREASLDAMEKRDGDVDSSRAEMRSVFRDFGAALKQSMPDYPPVPFLSGTLSNHAFYHAGNEKGALLFRYSDGFLLPPSRQDKLGSKIKELIGGYEKIEKKVIRSLERQGPASRQMDGFSTASKAVDRLFGKQAVALSKVAALAETVKRDGVYIEKESQDQIIF